MGINLNTNNIKKQPSIICLKKCFWLVFIHLFLILTTSAQYFNGPNKPDYKEFDYKVYNTPHFEIYHYFNNDSVLNSLALIAEKWYQRHQMIFKDTLKKKNPIIIYENHADFEQTNAIMGNIGIGTGGVTEALKNRIVLPVMESAAQTDHVIGHELVHAFQYNLILGADSSQTRNIRNAPLWMVEGLAEYMSIGSFDTHTSMWMRDAIINNDFPTLDELTRSYKYFPYRYGQAFWAFISSLYGDSIILPLFNYTSKVGYEKALESLTVYDEKTFSKYWKSTTRDYYMQFLHDSIEHTYGKKILSKKNSGTINIAPSLSPDGKYVIFLSEKDLFTFDLFLADAYSGKILKKISSTIRDNKIDDFNFLESGGTWSPDGKTFAFVTFSKGRNRLLIINVLKNSQYEEIDIPNIEAFSNPAWSPDGNSIVVSGLKSGVTDLYLYNFRNKTTVNLTNDSYCNMLPSWSNDGNFIVFSTDKPLNSDKPLSYGYNLGLLNLKSGKILVFNVFSGAQNLNPQFSPDDKSIFFLSNSDGFRNLYRYVIDSDLVYRITKLKTGISGITEFTPAFSIDKQKGNIVYTHYFKSEYNLYHASDSCFKPELVDKDLLNFDAGYLPPFKRIKNNIVNNNIAGNDNSKVFPKDSFKTVPYKSRFTLDYVGGSSMGVSSSSYYGTGMAGSIEMLWSDMVGNYQLYSSLAVNGQVYDMGGSLAFINTKHKIDWGVSLSHIPYRYGTYSYEKDTINKSASNVLVINNDWIFEDAFTLFATKSLSQTTRVEAFSSIAYYSQYLEKQKYIETSSGYQFYALDKNQPTSPSFGLLTFGTAYTLDNAYMGIASPLRGQRFRAEIKYLSGGLNFLNFLIDYRKYIFINPICIAARVYHNGRYGSSTTNSLFQASYLGWPWLVRGYENYDPSNNGQDLNLLYGSKLAVANLEVRIPFTGPERLCLIPFKYLMTELSFFTDAGIAWNSSNKLTFNINHNVNLGSTQKTSNYRYPMISYGVSLRINVLGLMILEPYYAIPIQKNGLKYSGLGFNFLPGW